MLVYPRGSYTHQRGRILVVDQDDWCREFLSQVIKLGNFGEFFLSTSVDEALAQLERLMFDVLITDLKVPEHQRLLDECRRRFPAMRFILMAHRGSQLYQFVQLEQVEIVIKPLSLDEMARKIREALLAGHRLKVEENIMRLKQEGFRL
jgi:DNA-binding NtrC family response regulator